MDEQELTVQGLSSQEAERLRGLGKANVPSKGAGRSVGQIILENLFTWFNILNVLLALALASVQSWRNMLFMGVVVFNTLISTIQEIRAKQTVDRLTLLVAAPVAVLRDGQWIHLPAEDLVEGDVVRLSAGDQVCADAMVLSGQGAADESLLSGESEPVNKVQGDELLSGSAITEGQLLARLTKVGDDSYAGQLVQSVRKVKVSRSQLMEDMKKLIRVVSYFLVPMGVVLFAKQHLWLDHPIERAIPSTVAAMIGMIPEGLMLLTSMSLAVGVIRLGEQNTLVQELYGIENLARVDTLCVDKTGTITTGSLRVEQVVPLEGTEDGAVDRDIRLMLGASQDDNLTFQALRAHWQVEAPSAMAEGVEWVPFSSARKWSATVFTGKGSVVLGAPEFILGDGMPEALGRLVARYAAQGLRVLLLARSPHGIERYTLPPGLQPRALILLGDHIREDFAQIAHYLEEEGVEVKVVSGDNPLTVKDVARRAGLSHADRCVDMSRVTEQEALNQAAEECTVYGRVSPEQKRQLVQSMKDAGRTVAMMGDGVNDVPALKVCDCAIAMAGGSDAARRVSQVTLLDQNFSALPQVILEGRRVINNITRSASLFLVKTIFSFLMALLTLALPIQYPFQPIQLTIISTFTVGIPSFFLALTPNRDRVRGNFLRTILRNSLPGALTNVLLLLAMYYLSRHMGLTHQQRSTIALVVVGFTGLLILALTSLPLNFARGTLLIAMTLGLMVTAVTMPRMFYLTSLPGAGWWVMFALMALSPALLLTLRGAVKLILKPQNGLESTAKKPGKR